LIGVLDTHFLGSGYYPRTDLSAVATDFSGRIYLAGSTSVSGISEATVLRLSPEGILDPTFAIGGVFRLGTPWNNSTAKAIRIDSSGRILCTGTWGLHLLVVCLRTDGTLDSSFSGDGIGTHIGDAGGGREVGFDIATDSLGRILVTGFAEDSQGNSKVLVRRYLSTGVADTGFSSDGVLVDVPQINWWSWGMGIVANDKIYVTGFCTNYSWQWAMYVLCYTDDGARDASFGTNGAVVYDHAGDGFAASSGNGIALDGTEILVAGSAGNLAAVWRLTPTGTRVSSFASDGLFPTGGLAGGTADTASGICVKPSGEVFLAGYSWDGLSGYDIAVWAIDPDGSTLWTYTEPRATMDYGWKLVLTSDRVLVATSIGLMVLR